MTTETKTRDYTVTLSKDEMQFVFGSLLGTIGRLEAQEAGDLSLTPLETLAAKFDTGIVKPRVVDLPPFLKEKYGHE